jgi:hypothetical protein
MAHILIGGDSSAGSAVSSLLQQWGMTSGRIPVGIEGAQRPTINECDAVILVHPFAGSFTPEPGGPDSIPPAPLLLLGVHPGRVLLARDAQQVVLDPGPAGAQLKSALQACLDRTTHLRGRLNQAGRQGDQDGYLHFLGHELRSPLTAAKTALEVLQGELGGMEEDQTGPPGESVADRKARLKMLDIALRNIKRLHRTVDWSQDLLEYESSSPASQLLRLSGESLAEIMGQAVNFNIQEAVRGRYLESDPKLLRILAGQLVRVLDIALPECPLAGELGLAGEGDGCLEMVLRPLKAQGCLDGPRITRTHLTPASGSCECTPCQELERLAGYVVSTTLLEQLQAVLRVQLDPDGVPTLALRLDLVDSASHEGLAGSEHPAVLRAPA